MEEVIDFTKQESDEPVYLKKSARLYKISGVLILFSIAMSVFVKPLLYEKSNEYADLLDMLIGLPFLTVFVLTPPGLFYSWKSYQRKEGQSKTRFKYALGHSFFCLLLILIIGMFIVDISKLLK